MKPEVQIYIACLIAVGAFLAAIVHGVRIEFRAKRLEEANKDLARQLATEKAAHDERVAGIELKYDNAMEGRALALAKAEEWRRSLETANAEVQRLEGQPDLAKEAYQQEIKRLTALSIDHYNDWKRCDEELDLAKRAMISWIYARPPVKPKPAKKPAKKS